MEEHLWRKFEDGTLTERGSKLEIPSSSRMHVCPKCNGAGFVEETGHALGRIIEQQCESCAGMGHTPFGAASSATSQYHVHDGNAEGEGSESTLSVRELRRLRKKKAKYDAELSQVQERLEHSADSGEEETLVHSLLHQLQHSKQRVTQKLMRLEHNLHCSNSSSAGVDRRS